MQAVQLTEPNDEFNLVDLPVPEPGPDEVRVEVRACGICHSDAFARQGSYPGVTYPLVPGHEVAGVVDAVGDEVEAWASGDRVGVGWHGGHCFTCGPCREGDFVNCEDAEATGITFDGGYAEYCCVREEAVAALPDELEFAEAAPLLCAGITTYNALRHVEAAPGDLAAVQGVGGLGHLAVQYARQFGYEVAAVSTSPDKADLARSLGADHFVDVSEENPAEALQELGGADLVLATAPSSQAIDPLTGALGRDGTLMIVGAAPGTIEVSPMWLIDQRRSIRGWPSGAPTDSEDTLDFSALTGIRPMIETYPLSEAAEAYEAMMENEVRFRAVLVPDARYEG